MKSITTKMLVSLVGVALAAPFFAVAVIVGARVLALSENAQDDLMLVGLATIGAALSVINGFGRRIGEDPRTELNRSEAKEGVDSHGASLINLGY